LGDSRRGRAGATGATDPAGASFEALIDELRGVLAGIRHGSVTLIVQDGRVVQIDATRKLRFAARGSPPQPETGTS
jgi:hypothetical protein